MCSSDQRMVCRSQWPYRKPLRHHTASYLARSSSAVVGGFSDKDLRSRVGGVFTPLTIADTRWALLYDSRAPLIHTLILAWTHEINVVSRAAVRASSREKRKGFNTVGKAGTVRWTHESGGTQKTAGRGGARRWNNGRRITRQDKNNSPQDSRN